MITGIYIDNQRLDLFEEEGINVNSSVLDIQDITKNTTEYTNSFTVPASGINNRIFKHYYNADIDDAFDARVPVTARIELGGILFREGEITLKNVLTRKNQPYAYVINFYGKLLSFKETLGTDKLCDLDFSAFNQDYEPDFIEALLTNNQTPYEIANVIAHRVDLTCALLSNRALFYASNNDPFDIAVIRNIYYDVSQTDDGVLWNELKPAFLVRSIMEQIETDYGLTFTGGFFDRSDFSRMYLYLDNGSEDKTAGEETFIVTDAGAYTWINTNNVTIQRLANFNYDINIYISPSVGYTDIPYTLRIYRDGSLVIEKTTSGSDVISAYLATPGTYVYTYSIEVKEFIEYTPTVEVQEYNGAAPTVSESATTAAVQDAVITYEVSKHMPDMTILDFLKGLIQMFKLVIIPTSETDVYINNVDDYYSEGNLIDLTKYVDTKEISISRGELLNNINYKFQDPTTILNKQFKGTTKEGYGDEELFIYDGSGNLIDGTKSNIELPFEQVIYDRLIDSQDKVETNIQYGAIIDDKLASTNIKPHIFHAVLQSIGAKTMAFNYGGGINELSASYWYPSHVKSNTTFDTGLVFGSEVEEYTKLTMTDTLYTEYYSTYISGLFNIKRRTYTLQSKNVPINIITDMRLNDVIKIGINYYRIDKMNTNIVTGEIKFNLFNILELDI